MEKSYTVYQHITPDGRRYIGATSLPPVKRWNNGGGYRCNTPFYEAIQLYGWANIAHEIIAEGLTAPEAERREERLIKRFHTTDPARGFNRSSSGQGFRGGKHTAETRQRISDSLRGTDHTPVYILRDDGDGLHAYSTLSKAAQLTGADPANISKAAHGQRNRAGGYIWHLGNRHETGTSCNKKKRGGRGEM